MSDHFQEQQLHRHVRALYNYNVGQKAGPGVALLLIALAVALVYGGAYLMSMFSGIASGLSQLP